MQTQATLMEDRALHLAATPLNKTSLARTDYTVSAGHPHQQHSQSFNSQTLTDTLPFNSRAYDFQQNSAFVQMQQELSQLHHRFEGIHKIFINHSEFESDLHQSKRGYKVLPIDRDALVYDFSNKAQLITEIRQLVEQAEQETEIDELLECKFQQYYLQRHYGSLECNFGNLSIQERQQQRQQRSELFDEPVKSVIQQQIPQLKSTHSSPQSSIPSQPPSSLSPQKNILSKLSHFQSLIPQSKITYSQQFCQTQQGYDVYVQLPRIIQVDIPVVVYKERVIKYQESQMMGDIGLIIDKFSMAYEDIYSQAGEGEGKDEIVFGEKNNTNTGVLVSRLPSVATHTEIQLAYSDFPQEDQLKLPLDSYAQLGSLISNTSSPNTDRSDHELPLPTDTVYITQKVTSRSILQKYQETERTLILQNAELKQYISTLETQLSDQEKIKVELEKHNNRLARRLEEEIQQSEYYSSKLDELNVELLEQKVQALEHIGSSKDRKIQMLSEEIKNKSEELQMTMKQLVELETTLKINESLLIKKDEEIQHLSNLLQQKEYDLAQVATCQDDMIQLASETQINLKDQIQKLEKEKGQLKDNLKFYRQRLQDQGISLQMDEATQIQSYIEQRQHNFNLQLQEVNKKYQEIINSYNNQLEQLKEQLIKLKAMNELKSKTIEQKELKVRQVKKEQEQHCLQFQDIVNEYHGELENKDNEILNLKRSISQMRLEVRGDAEVAVVIERAYKTIKFLEQQLLIQRKHKSTLSAQLVQLDTLVHNFINCPSSQDDAHLIDQLNTQLQNKIYQTNQLKNQLADKEQQLTLLLSNKTGDLIESVQLQNIKLKKSNNKLKIYAESLQQEIRVLCSCGFEKSTDEEYYQAGMDIATC